MKLRKVLKYILLSFLGIVGIVVLVVGLFIAWIVFDSPFDDQKFDLMVWVEHHNSRDPDNPRGKMADDLEKRLLKDRPTRAQVIALLGPPDSMSTSDWRKKNFLSYNLGMWSGIGLDYDSFDIYFDDEGRVQMIKLIQH